MKADRNLLEKQTQLVQAQRVLLDYLGDCLLLEALSIGQVVGDAAFLKCENEPGHFEAVHVLRDFRAYVFEKLQDFI